MFLGMSKEKIARLEDLLRKHSLKTLIGIKLAPLLALPGIMLIGAIRMPFIRFVSISLAVTLARSLVFIVAGYTLGKAFDSFSKIFKYNILIIIVVFAIIALLYWAYKKLSAKFSARI